MKILREMSDNRHLSFTTIIQQCEDVVKFTIHLHTNLHSVITIENLQQ